MAQLDGLRAIAVLAVFADHWLPGAYRLGVAWGESGVDLFFVLSGFLITGILLTCRRYVDEAGQSVLTTAKQFYIRRTLRIWPLYFGVLLLYMVAAQDPTNWLSPWLWTFTLNFYRTFVEPTWGGPMSHFWSLAVEEQFYLVWPWVILLTPRRYLLPVLIGAVLIGPLTKIMMALVGYHERAIRFFTLSCLDTLAFGGLLAYFSHLAGVERIANSRVVAWLGPLSLLLLGAGLVLRLNSEAPLERMALFMSAKTLFLGWIVIKAAHGFRGAVGFVLSARPVMYIGKISFGLYLLSKPLAALVERMGLPVEDIHPLVVFSLYSALSVGAATLSWNYFEAPINRLKRHFPYHVDSTARKPSVDTASQSIR
ncbi:MAG: acyltransferase [Nitrospirota bacterium]